MRLASSAIRAETSDAPRSHRRCWRCKSKRSPSVRVSTSVTPSFKGTTMTRCSSFHGAVATRSIAEAGCCAVNSTVRRATSPSAASDEAASRVRPITLSRRAPGRRRPRRCREARPRGPHRRQCPPLRCPLPHRPRSPGWSRPGTPDCDTTMSHRLLRPRGPAATAGASCRSTGCASRSVASASNCPRASSTSSKGVSATSESCPIAAKAVARSRPSIVSVALRYGICATARARLRKPSWRSAT